MGAALRGTQVKDAVIEIQRRSGLLYRTGVGFIVCKRARVVALLHLWSEGEAGVKFEMRTGKRVRCANAITYPPCGIRPGYVDCPDLDPVRRQKWLEIYIYQPAL